MPYLNVVFDSNVYRKLSGAEFAAVMELERAQSIVACSSYWVLFELLAHVASQEDPEFNHAWAALKRLWHHCAIYDGSAYRLQCLADWRSEICRLLFGRGLADRDDADVYGLLVGVIANAETPEDWEKYQPMLDQLASHVDEVERRFLDGMLNNVARRVAPGAVDWEAAAEIPATRAELADALTLDTGIRSAARIIVSLAAEDVGIGLQEAELNEKTDYVADAFEAPLRFLNAIVAGVVREGTNISTRRANSVWDFQIEFSTSPEVTMAGVPVWLITDDNAMLAAAREAKIEGLFRSLGSYRSVLESSYDEFRRQLDTSRSHGIQRSL